MAHVMFGGLTHEPAVELARRLVRIAPSGLAARLLLRLGLGGRRGRDQDGAAVLVRGAAGRARRACSRSAAATTATPSARWRCATRSTACTSASGRFSPQHLFADRPAQPLRRARASPATSTALQRSSRRTRRARRGDPRADRAGRRRHVVLLRRLPARACASSATARRAADRRRDRHRLRPHRAAVRLRARRHRAGHPVPRQGADRRLPEPGRDARDARESRTGISGRTAASFMHGPTFMANPLRPRWRARSIDLLLDGPWQARVAAIEAQLAAELRRCRGAPGGGRRARARRDRRRGDARAGATWRICSGASSRRACGSGRSGSSST